MSIIAALSDRQLAKYAENPATASEANAEIARRKEVAINLEAITLVEANKVIENFGFDTTDVRTLVIAYVHIASPKKEWYGVTELPAPLSTLKSALYARLKAENLKLSAQAIQAYLVN